MSQDKSLIICLTTVATHDDADEIAERLLRHHLAACVQIEGPIRSHYIWKATQCCDEEFRLVIKTSRDAWSRLESMLTEIHPYDEPQILMWHITDATEGYRDWVLSQTEPR